MYCNPYRFMHLEIEPFSSSFEWVNGSWHIRTDSNRFLWIRVNVLFFYEFTGGWDYISLFSFEYQTTLFFTRSLEEYKLLYSRRILNIPIENVFYGNDLSDLDKQIYSEVYPSFPVPKKHYHFPFVDDKEYFLRLKGFKDLRFVHGKFNYDYRCDFREEIKKGTGFDSARYILDKKCCGIKSYNQWGQYSDLDVFYNVDSSDFLFGPFEGDELSISQPYFYSRGFLVSEMLSVESDRLYHFSIRPLPDGFIYDPLRTHYFSIGTTHTYFYCNLDVSTMFLYVNGSHQLYATYNDSFTWGIGHSSNSIEFELRNRYISNLMNFNNFLTGDIQILSENSIYDSTFLDLCTSKQLNFAQSVYSDYI